MAIDPEGIAKRVIGKLETAWNAADGNAFAEPFAADADFVDIRADYHNGRVPIAMGHQALLDSIYKGSSVRYELIQARSPAEGVIIAHGAATMTAPIGPLAGENRATFSFVLLGSGDAWQIAAFHNTLAQPG